MADLQTVIGLLYRADWTRFSLSASVRSERDGDLAVRRLRAMRPSGFRPGPTMRLRPDPGGGPPIMEDVPEEELGGTEPGDPGEFRLQVPPGVRVVEETGNPFTDATAVMSGVSGAAVRTAADLVRRTAGAVSATPSFLDDLSGGRPPASG